jgi:hypothetical protein
LNEALVSNGPLAIIGNAAEPAKIKVAASIIASGAIVVKNVEFDATDLKAPLFAFNSEPNEALKVASGQYVITDPIEFDNVKVSNLAKAFVTDNGKAYAFKSFTINNCVIGIGEASNVILNFAASMPMTLNITNSTIFAKSMSGNFAAISGKRTWQITGYDNEKGLINLEKNTFYNLANKKQFINTNTLKGQKDEIYRFQKNIFVNCGNKQIWDKITNGNNTIEVSDNTYWYDGENAGEKYDTEVLTTDPGLKDPENGDFTPSGVQQINHKTGDPRWLN